MFRQMKRYTDDGLVRESQTDLDVNLSLFDVFAKHPHFRILPQFTDDWTCRIIRDCQTPDDLNPEYGCDIQIEQSLLVLPPVVSEQNVKHFQLCMECPQKPLYLQSCCHTKSSTKLNEKVEYCKSIPFGIVLQS